MSYPGDRGRQGSNTDVAQLNAGVSNACTLNTAGLTIGQLILTSGGAGPYPALTLNQTLIVSDHASLTGQTSGSAGSITIADSNSLDLTGTTNASTWSGTSLLGPGGNVKVESGVTLNVTNMAGGPPQHELLGTQLFNYGTLNLQNSTTQVWITTDDSNAHRTLITNEGGATIDISVANDNGIVRQGGSADRGTYLENRGTLTINNTNAGYYGIAGSCENNGGTVNLTSGNLWFSVGVITSPDLAGVTDVCYLDRAGATTNFNGGYLNCGSDPAYMGKAEFYLGTVNFNSNPAGQAVYADVYATGSRFNLGGSGTTIANNSISMNGLHIKAGVFNEVGSNAANDQITVTQGTLDWMTGNNAAWLYTGIGPAPGLRTPMTVITWTAHPGNSHSANQSNAAPGWTKQTHVNGNGNDDYWYWTNP
jgi:hypothetical protein